MNALETQIEVSVAFFLIHPSTEIANTCWDATGALQGRRILENWLLKVFRQPREIVRPLVERHEHWRVLTVWFGVLFLAKLKVHESYLDLLFSFFILHCSNVARSPFQSYRKLSSTSSEESIPISSIMSISSTVSSSRFTNVELLDPVSMALSSDVWELGKNAEEKKKLRKIAKPHRKYLFVRLSYVYGHPPHKKLTPGSVPPLNHLLYTVAAERL